MANEKLFTPSESIKRKKILTEFKRRLRTQDRGSRLPMRLICKLFGRDTPELKELDKSFDKLIESTANNVKFLIDQRKAGVPFKEIAELQIDENDEVSAVLETNGKVKPVFTEIHGMGISASKKQRERLKAPHRLKDMTLDHDIPISVLLDCAANELPRIKDLGRAYAQFLKGPDCKEKGRKPHTASEKAARFMKNGKGDGFDAVFMEELLNELELLFKAAPLTVMYSKYNASKNSSCVYCERVETCGKSGIKKSLDILKRKQS